MAWLYEKSALWRAIVRVTRGSPLAFGAFGLTVGVVVPYYVTAGVMGLTNPEQEAERIAELRKRQGLNAQVLASVNKERLAVLLGEVQNKDTSQERYRQSLDGRTLGTLVGSSKPEQ